MGYCAMMQGSEMRALRKQMGLTQSQLAAALDMTQTYIGLMERDKAPIETRTYLSVLYLSEHPEALDR